MLLSNFYNFKCFELNMYTQQRVLQENVRFLKPRKSTLPPITYTETFDRTLMNPFLNNNKQISHFGIPNEFPILPRSYPVYVKVGSSLHLGWRMEIPLPSPNTHINPQLVRLDKTPNIRVKNLGKMNLGSLYLILKL